ncbi:MAG TPA: hypothetical protein VIM11_26315 [Tepidisphaeraceae bacterium]|jgi:hypothetical protein
MRLRWNIAALMLGLLTVPAATPAAPADPPPKPPETEEVLSQRQQSLLLQLSDAEANIKALNLALVRTGYKVGLAYDRIDTSQKGNDIMNRKGGGPVGWQDFYGKTARSFYIPYSEGTYHSESRNGRTDIHVTEGNHPIQRPTQFNYIYKANNDQIARAKEQVASLAQDQAALLARRQKHEADQSRLWAQLAWERVKDREIADEPQCRFKLRSASKSDSRAELLRPLILFLRTSDKAASDGLDSIESDQDATFADLSPRMKAAYATLRASLADSLLATDLKDDTKKQTDAIKTLCKQLSEECSIVVDNYRNALDRDKAKEDNSKLVFRGKLQESLALFASAVAELDVQLAETAKAWNITPDKNAPTPDSVPAAARATVAKSNTTSGDVPANGSPESLLKTARAGEISGDGEWTAWEPLVEGGKIIWIERLKRFDTWGGIPPSLSGRSWQIGKTKPNSTLLVTQDGAVMVASFPAWLDRPGARGRVTNRQKLLKNGWTELAQIKDSRDVVVVVYIRICKKGESFTFSNPISMPILIK